MTDYTKKLLKGLTITENQAHPLRFIEKSDRDIKYLVVHYTGNFKDTAENNANYFKSNPRNNSYASAHLFVDNDIVILSVELNNIAYHCGSNSGYKHADCRNANSIGIEMCCFNNYAIHKSTIERTANVISRLAYNMKWKSEDINKWLLRHYDVTGKICPGQFVRNPLEWVEFKKLVKKKLDYKYKKYSN